MTTRRGLGKGLGTGYRNLVYKDPYIHGLSAKGVKTIDYSGAVVPDIKAVVPFLDARKTVLLKNGNLVYIEPEELNKNWIWANEKSKGDYGWYVTKYDVDKILNAKAVDKEKLAKLKLLLGADFIESLQKQVKSIEDDVSTTKNNYGRYMAILSNFNPEERKLVVMLLVFLGANAKGVKDAYEILL